MKLHLFKLTPFLPTPPPSMKTEMLGTWSVDHYVILKNKILAGGGKVARISDGKAADAHQ